MQGSQGPAGKSSIVFAPYCDIELSRDHVLAYEMRRGAYTLANTHVHSVEAGRAGIRCATRNIGLTRPAHIHMSQFMALNELFNTVDC